MVVTSWLLSFNLYRIADERQNHNRFPAEDPGLTGLSSSIETQHQDAHFLRAEDLSHHLGYLATHFGELVGGVGSIEESGRKEGGRSVPRTRRRIRHEEVEAGKTRRSSIFRRGKGAWLSHPSRSSRIHIAAKYKMLDFVE